MSVALAHQPYLPPLSARTAAHMIEGSRCAHCHGTVEIECEALPGFWGYRTYDEYFCTHCRKQNHGRTTGGVVFAHVPAAHEGKTDVRGAKTAVTP